MNKKFLLISVLVAGLLLSACASTSAETATEEPVAAEPALTLSGTAEASWTADDLNAMTLVDVDYTNSDDETTTYSGVLISDLLAAAGVTDYTKLTLVASDDYTAEVTADELAACTNCIVAFDADGSLRTVMPDLAGSQNVANLVAITVE